MDNIWFRSVKKYYEMGFYSNDDVKVFVQAEFITEEQYKKITGEEYAV